MSVKKTLVLVLALVLVSTSAATAGYFGFYEKNELEDSFCPDLENTEIYEKKNLENYANLIPGKNGWIFRTENDFRSEWTVNEKTRNYLNELQEAFRAQNAELVLVAPPIRGMVHADNLFRRHKGKYGLKNPDAVWENYETSIGSMRQSGINVAGVSKGEAPADFFYMRDHHWTAHGAQAMARSVAEIVRALPTYSRIPKMEFVTNAQESLPYKSSFEKAFRKICNSKIPAEISHEYVTVPAAAAVGQDALFSDTAEPQVVLLGTSNSVVETSHANFDGFLKEYIGADILNMSYVGAGVDTSLMSYLNTPHFRNGEPKIVIWEVPGYYDLNVMDDKLFNQAIPAAYGSCSGNPIYSRTVVLKEGGNVLMDVGRAQVADLSGQVMPVSDSLAAVSGSDRKLYLRLAYANPADEKFAVNFQYDNGGTKKQQFDSSGKEQEHAKEFYTLFPMGQKNEDLSRVVLVVPAALAGNSVDIEVCATPSKKMVDTQRIQGTDSGRSL